MNPFLAQQVTRFLSFARIRVLLLPLLFACRFQLSLSAEVVAILENFI